jgi:hypothetical protein
MYRTDGTVSSGSQDAAVDSTGAAGSGGASVGATPANAAPSTETELGDALGNALETQAELKQRTDALEAQLQAEQLRQTLSAAVVENQRLKARLESMVESRQQLLGGIPLAIRQSDGTKYAPGAGPGGDRGSVPRRGAKSSVDLLRGVSGVDPDTGAVEFRSDMAAAGRGMETGMPLKPLPRGEGGDGHDGEDDGDRGERSSARVETAMVLTFGAVAASKLPPKRRPRPDPRLLDKLLNGVELPPPPRGIDARLSGGHVATHWGPTAAPGIAPPQFMDPAPAAYSSPAAAAAGEPKDVAYRPPFERKR